MYLRTLEKILTRVLAVVRYNMLTHLLMCESHFALVYYACYCTFPTMI